MKQISTELRIAPESLRRWAKRSDLDTGRRRLTTEEREELRRLRREVRILAEKANHRPFEAETDAPLVSYGYPVPTPSPSPP